MPLTQFQRNTLNTRITTLVNALPEASQDQPTKERLLIAYQVKIFSELKAILKKRKHDKALKSFLSDNWAFVKSTALSYTALPQNDLTKILCDIANALSDEENPAITLLMPGISTEHLSDAEKDLDEMDLEHVIKTHILGDDATYLIPVNLMSTIATCDDLSKINNPYFNYSIHQEKGTCLSTTELARLFQHSEHTQLIASLKKSLDGIAIDQSHLLGQLKKLICLMAYNSAHNGGIGTSEIAAKGGFVAIAEFFDYFNQLSKNDKDNLPESIKKQLAILTNLAESGGQQKDADGNLVMEHVTRKITKRDREGNSLVTEETVAVPVALLENASMSSCLSTRKAELADAIQGHEEFLASISLSEKQKSDLLTAIQQKLVLAFHDFKNALSSRYIGMDSLNITAKLLNTFNIDFNPKDSEEISGIFKFLNADEISELLTLDNAAEKVVLAISTLENFVILTHELSSEKLALLLSKTKRELKKNILLDRRDRLGRSDIRSYLITLDQPDDVEKLNIIFSALVETSRDVQIALSALTPDQRTAVYNARQEQLLTLIKTADDLATIIHYLTPDQCTAVCNARQEQLLTLIKTADDFATIIRYLTPDQCTAVCNARQEQLLTLIKTADDFARIIHCLTPDQCTAVCNARQEQLLTLIKTADDFAGIIRYLTPDQCTTVCNACQKQLPSFIKTADDFARIIRYLTPDQRTAVYNACQKQLPSFIKTADDFARIRRYLTPDQCTAVGNACQKQLPSLIKTADDFARIIPYLTPDQRTAVGNACQKQLPSLIKTADDFARIIPYLTPDQRTAVCNACQKQLPSFIKTADDFARIIRYLTPDQCTAVCNAGQKQLLTLIKTTDDFARIIRYLTPNQCTAVCNAGQKQLLTLIKTADDFVKIIYYLEGDRRTAVYNACQEQLPSLIKTTDDFISIIRYLKGDQRIAVYNACHALLRTTIKTTDDFERLIPFLTTNQQIDLCNSIRKKIPALIEEKRRTASMLNKFDILFLQWLMLVSDLQNHISRNKADPAEKNSAIRTLRSLTMINLNEVKLPAEKIQGFFKPVKNRDPEHFLDRRLKLIKDYHRQLA